MEDSYEKQLFEAMASYVKEKAGKTNNEEELLLQSLHLTYYLGQSRSVVFNNKDINTLKASLIHPVTYDLMTSNGACGSYAYILSRLLNELKIPNRVAQMQVNGLYGGHIMVEAKTAKGWVALDGLYDLYFKKPDGNLASFTDIQGHWDLYRSQVPANYDNNYRYEGVRYTNWNKIPVLMPLLKDIFYLFLGKESTETFSFRTLMLRKFHILLECAVGIYLLLAVVVIRRYIRKNKETIAVYLPVLFHAKRVQNAGASESIENRA